jgi:hypothetical protein
VIEWVTNTLGEVFMMDPQALGTQEGFNFSMLLASMGIATSEDSEDDKMNDEAVEAAPGVPTEEEFYAQNSGEAARFQGFDDEEVPDLPHGAEEEKAVVPAADPRQHRFILNVVENMKEARVTAGILDTIKTQLGKAVEQGEQQVAQLRRRYENHTAFIPKETTHLFVQTAGGVLTMQRLMGYLGALQDVLRNAEDPMKAMIILEYGGELLSLETTRGLDAFVATGRYETRVVPGDGMEIEEVVELPGTLTVLMEEVIKHDRFGMLSENKEVVTFRRQAIQSDIYTFKTDQLVATYPEDVYHKDFTPGTEPRGTIFISLMKRTGNIVTANDDTKHGELRFLRDISRGPQETLAIANDLGVRVELLEDKAPDEPTPEDDPPVLDDDPERWFDQLEVTADSDIGSVGENED